jgi:hypothetical protein
VGQVGLWVVCGVPRWSSVSWLCLCLPVGGPWPCPYMAVPGGVEMGPEGSSRGRGAFPRWHLLLFLLSFPWVGDGKWCLWHRGGGGSCGGIHSGVLTGDVSCGHLLSSRLVLAGCGPHVDGLLLGGVFSMGRPWWVVCVYMGAAGDVPVSGAGYLLG